MKTHSVKSNAKRAARKIAEAEPEKWEAVEPEVAPGGGWFATVRAKLPDLARTDAVVVPLGGRDTTLSAEDAQFVADLCVDAGVSADVQAQDDGFKVTLGLQPAPAAPAKPKPVDLPTKPKPLAGRDLAEAAVSIPPTRSTPDEIEARRAERRARVAEEKAAGVRDAAGNKLDPAKVARGPTKAAIIVALTSRHGGATVDDLMTATGWQRHTLRGYIAGTLRKRGHAIEVVTTPGEPTIYLIRGAAA